jgi:protein gp37
MVANPRITVEAHNAARSVVRFEKLRPRCWSGKSALVQSWLDAPLHWKKPQVVGVCFLSDLFAEAVPDEWIDQVFARMARCPQHTFVVLTKQAERMEQYVRVARSFVGIKPQGHFAWPLPNIWLGVSVSDQAEAETRVPVLLRTSAELRLVNYEPALGPLHLGAYGQGVGDLMVDGLDWVVVGCESGAGRRAMPWKWAEDVVGQCRASGVRCWVKQLDGGDRVLYPGMVGWPEWARQERPGRG